MTVDEIVKELEAFGSQINKKALSGHNIPEPYFGVKIQDLKVIQKRIKKDYKLALELFETGIYDAMYLAGLIADDGKMTKTDLRGWIKKAHCYPICEFTVPWVASESKHGHNLALEWIDSKKESIASAGWATYSSLVSIKDDADLDLTELKNLLQRVEKTIHQQPNRVRYTMNGFVIAVGAYVKDLTESALQTATRIGTVKVDMGKTSCKVPHAPEYIQKIQKRGSIGKKRKTAKC